MGRDKKSARRPGPGDHAKDRHNKDRKGKDIDWSVPHPVGLVARPEKPKSSSKYQSYFEFVENTDKKAKKLEFQVTTDAIPPPGFEFVPVGNPELTKTCKELSREQDAMIFIVTEDFRSTKYSAEIKGQTSRIGHHFRQAIADRARDSIGLTKDLVTAPNPGVPEPIPERQADINKQADAAIRDLFPRIPNTDRQAIVEHAFRKDAHNRGDPRVGLASNVGLSRRVGLAVLAHIRHTHTRYDQLLQETSWENARKVVESLCLDILAKWRGDEETGRDQLDEILREVIVISDSDSESDGYSDSDSGDEGDEYGDGPSSPSYSPSLDQPGSFAGNDALETAATAVIGQASRVGPLPLEPRALQLLPHQGGLPADAVVTPGVTPGPVIRPGSRRKKSKAQRRAGRRAARFEERGPAQQDARRVAKASNRGFKRYQAVRDVVWSQALERNRRGPPPDNSAPVPTVPPSQSAGNPSEHEGYPQDSFGYQTNNAPTASTQSGQDAWPFGSAPRSQHASAGSLYGQHGPSSVGHGPMHQAALVHYDPPYSGRVSYRSENLRDHPVQSIEPRSPDNPQFPRQVVDQVYRPLVVPVSRSSDQGFAERDRIMDEQGFIQLPPRELRDPLRHSPMVRDQRVLRSMNNPPPPGRSLEAGTAYNLRAGPSSGRRGYMDGSSSDLSLSAREEARHFGMEGRGAARTASDPITILDSSPRRDAWVRGQPSPAAQETGRLPRRRLVEVIGVRSTPPAPPFDRNSRFAAVAVPPPRDNIPSGHTEIVQVSNVFPRRYEPRGPPTPIHRYDLRSTQSSMIDRVDPRVEEPPRPIMRHPAGDPEPLYDIYGHPARQERIAITEYVPIGYSGPEYNQRYPQPQPVYQSPGSIYHPAAHTAPPGSGSYRDPGQRSYPPQ